MSPLHFPDSVPGRLRVAYLIAQAIAEQNGEHRPHAEDKGGGRVWISGVVDLGAVVDALMAAAPPETPLWWNDGPIRDEASTACLAVLERHGWHLPGIADLCAGAALQVAHRAGYAPIRPLDPASGPGDKDVAAVV